MSPKNKKERLKKIVSQEVRVALGCTSCSLNSLCASTTPYMHAKHGLILYSYRKMLWQYFCFFILAFFVGRVCANEQRRMEINIQGIKLEKFVFKRVSALAPHICDIWCGQEITCQSYNYNRKEKICELNNRTKEARPESFRSAPGWFHIRRLNGRGMF